MQVLLFLFVSFLHHFSFQEVKIIATQKEDQHYCVAFYLMDDDSSIISEDSNECGSELKRLPYAGELILKQKYFNEALPTGCFSPIRQEVKIRSLLLHFCVLRL